MSMTLHLFAHTAGDRILRVRVLDPVADRIAIAAIQGDPRYVGETTIENLDGDVRLLCDMHNCKAHVIRWPERARVE